jgi:hypothetical protein
MTANIELEVRPLEDIELESVSGGYLSNVSTAPLAAPHWYEVARGQNGWWGVTPAAGQEAFDHGVLPGLHIPRL